MNLFLKDVKVAPLYYEIFGFANKDNSVLFELIKSGNFDENPLPKVRKIKRTKAYEVLIGVDVFEVSQRIAAEATYPKIPKLQFECEEVNLTDEQAVIVMLYDAVYSPPIYSPFSKFQTFFLSQLYSKFSKRQIPKEAIKKLTNTSETTYQNLQTSVNFAIGKLKIKYAEKYAELIEKHRGDEIYEKLTDLKLVEYAVKRNEWLEFCDFAAGKMAVNDFYRNVYKKEKPARKKVKKTFDKINEIFVTLQPLTDELRSLTEEERHLLSKMHTGKLHLLNELFLPEKQKRAIAKSNSKNIAGANENDLLFE